MAELIPDFEDDYLEHDDEEDNDEENDIIINNNEKMDNKKNTEKINNNQNITNNQLNSEIMNKNNTNNVDEYVNSLGDMDEEERAILEALDNFKEEIMVYEDEKKNIVLPPVPIQPILNVKNIEINNENNNIIPIVPIEVENNNENIIQNEIIQPVFDQEESIKHNINEKNEIRTSTDWTALYPSINDTSTTGPLYPTLSENINYDHKIHEPQVISKSDDDNEALIRQLMEENERLKNQLNSNTNNNNNNNIMMESKDYQETYHPGILNNTNNNNNNNIQQQEDITDESNYPIEESSASPAKDIRIDAEGIVYLQCGGCGQWLRVPGESQLVRCPKCGIVNKCVIGSETQQSQNNNDNNNTTVTLPQQPFYLQCFNRWRK